MSEPQINPQRLRTLYVMKILLQYTDEKGRDMSEKLFRTDKTFIGSRSMRSHSQEMLSARIFLKKEFPQIREKLWKETFWSQSFCLLTAGDAPVETIRQYIESQGEK